MTMLVKTILIDPPWKEQGGGRIKRGADKHYSLLTTPEIIEIIKKEPLFAPDPKGCHLYLWVTNNFIPDGLHVVSELGFRYRTLITWAKDKFGLGQYFRGQTEHMIFAVMGKLSPLNKDQSTLFQSTRFAHSSKPELSYLIIEKVSPPPRVELFARFQRRGWGTTGNQVREERTRTKMDNLFNISDFK